MSNIVTRFSPSPTGYLHIGGARTALINYIFAKQNNGKFLLRIEDTDNERNTKECIDAIFDSLKWLNIPYDDEPVIQSKNIDRHVEVANDLLKKDRAYLCFCSIEELESHKENCIKNNLTQQYSKKCRNLTNDEIKEKLQSNPNPVIRLKIPDEDSYVNINDMIKGKSSVHYNQIDDFILLRSDTTPVYMLSVVVDDHDMNITHIIRGDDHFTNTFRQIMLYKLNEWKIPEFAHLPLIHGSDGKKLSKILNAVGTSDYKNLGYLSEALKIYLATMGTSINVAGSLQEVVKNFKIIKLSKSATQFDLNFLGLINQKVLKSSDKKDIINHLIPFVESKLQCKLSDDDIHLIERAYPDVISRNKSLIDCSEYLEMYFKEATYDIKTFNDLNLDIYNKLKLYADKINYDSINTIKTDVMKFMEENKFNASDIAIFLRTIITGKEGAPNSYNLIYSIGKDNFIKRFIY